MADMSNGAEVGAELALATEFDAPSRRDWERLVEKSSTGLVVTGIGW